MEMDDMGKRKLVLALVSILCMSLLFNGILFLEWSKEKEANKQLQTEVTDLTAANDRLSKTIAELEGQIAYPAEEIKNDWQHSIWWQYAQLQGDSDKVAVLEQRIAENPIDMYFQKQKEPETTVDFAEYYYLYQNAWKDEMTSAYEQLLLLLKEPALQKKLMEDQEAAVAAIQADYDFVVAAFGAEGIYPHYGSNVWLISAGLAQQYKERAIALLEWAYLLDETSGFAFSATDFQQKYDASDILEKPQQGQEPDSSRENPVSE